MDKPRGYWTEERCLEEAKKYKTKKDFRVGSYSAYIISCRNRWLDEFEWLEDSATKKKWTSESCKKVAKKYNSVSEFLKHDKVAYNVACKNGWIKEYD